MRDSLGKKLHYRELTDQAVRSKSYRSLYQDRRLINDLDIVNELDGHSGCVNALSWSKSGNLLASGSDDQHLNIHTYQPSTTCNQFQLALTVATGHTQNIFSVKFMPHSNDRTVITAAGDCEVRIFDLEYAGEARAASVESTLAAEGRRRGRGTLYHGVRYLNDGDTNCRVYRSHGDRVKRIVTESSPHLFLTCSEDGEVRQWDLRQPSSAYPRSTHHRFRYQDPNSSSDSTSAPPPLISYKRYNLDLNTISCSASQPHYIALGGAHLHAFLHDRRMTGRDRLREAGRSLSATDSLSAEEQELMSQATQCVRKFAPRGQRQMKNSDTGHITACKISDARPDEMIVSWSGDHIYSFDLIRDPSLDDVSSRKSAKSNRVKGSRDRKRKRHVNGSEVSLQATGSASSRPRTADPPITGSGALRIRYRNGQCEDIPFSTANADPIPLTGDQQEAQRIARLTIKIRQLLLSKRVQSENLTSSNTFTEAFGHAASVIRDIDEKIRTWGYPLNPSPDQVYIQRSLRKTRESARRFVQAAGTLCRVLGARLETAFGPSLLMLEFSSVKVRRSNDMWMTSREWFGYDFIKAILLWLDSGIGSLVEGFTRPDDVEPGSKVASHLPIPAAEAGAESVDEYLVPYLLRFASDEPVLNLETNRFEVEANRQLFPTEKAAVQAFAAAVKIPFQDLSSGAHTSEDSTGVQEQDRQAAQKYWALKVARGILHNAAETINFSDMDRAFGGIGQSEEQVLSAEDRSIDPAISEEETEETIRNVDVIDANGDIVDGATAEDVADAAQALRHRAHAEANGSGEEDLIDSPSESAALLEEIEEGQSRHARVEVFDGEDDDSEVDNDYNEYDDDDDHDSGGDGDSDDNDDHDEDDDDDDSSEPDEVDGVPNVNNRRFLYRSAFDRRRARPRVEPDTPASRPTRMYRGHCNVRTVKDVNYFGPDDEYVVSGSDDGNFFIWDRKTSELVNVLEGDGEVVNVIQGHPYETMMAVSGIDHTIKIFSPDARARRAARLGQGTSAHDAASFSTLAYPPRMGRRLRPTAGTTTSEPAVPADTSMEIDETDDYVAPNGLKSRQRMHDAYRIMQQNNIEREGGNHEAMITRRALAQLSQRIAHHRAETGRAPAPEGLIQLAVENDCMVQ